MLRNFEGMKYVSDKQVVALDIGNAYTKYGYAGEATPRGFIPTEIKCPESKEIRRIHDYKDTEDLYQLLVEFLHALFFRYIIVTPKDVKVVIIESLLLPTKFRDTLAKVLFRHFEIGSLEILPAHLVATSTLGVDTALILDVGYEEAILIPVFEGVPILKSWQALPLAGKAVEARIRDDLKAVAPQLTFPEKTIEDIKVRTCFVTTLDRAKKFDTDNAPIAPPAVKYFASKTILIPGKTRERAFEVLWERDTDNLSIPTMILDAIIKSPLDTRRSLAENILLIGGTVMAKGFTARLRDELLYLVNSDLYKDRLKVKKFKFLTAPSKPNYTAWLGGALFGIADLPSRCISKENYLKSNRVPDWASLIDNQKEESNSILHLF